VHWLGRKPYADLAAYLRWFDVATIPFKLENLTHAISPVKLFEYFAGGKLVVATPMDETCQYPDVLLAEGANDFASKLDEALKLKDDPTMLELIDRVARQNTWEVRARALLDQLD
jgi:glycosyltransferase involved in cell wall biosynthesis